MRGRLPVRLYRPAILTVCLSLQEPVMSNTPIAPVKPRCASRLPARTLNNLNVRAPVEALADKCGLPITEDRLARLTVEDLRALLAGDYADQAAMLAWTPTPESRHPPVVGRRRDRQRFSACTSLCRRRHARLAARGDCLQSQ